MDEERVAGKLMKSEAVQVQVRWHSTRDEGEEGRDSKGGKVAVNHQRIEAEQCILGVRAVMLDMVETQMKSDAFYRFERELEERMHGSKEKDIQKAKNNKWCRDCGGRGTLHHCGSLCELVQPLWNSEWSFSTN